MSPQHHFCDEDTEAGPVAVGAEMGCGGACGTGGGSVVGAPYHVPFTTSAGGVTVV